MKRIWQVSAPYFCAGLVTTGETVTASAPILKWCRGKTRADLRGYFTRRGWRAVMVKEAS